MPAGGTGPSCPERTHALSYKLCCHIIESCSGRASLALVVPYPTHSQKINSGRRPGIYKCGRYHSRGRGSRHLWQTDLGQVPSFPSPFVMWACFLALGASGLLCQMGTIQRLWHSSHRSRLSPSQLSLEGSDTPGGVQSYNLCGEVNLLKAQGIARTGKQNKTVGNYFQWNLSKNLPLLSTVCCALTGESLGGPIWKTIGLVLWLHTTTHPLLCSWVLPSQTKTDFWVGWAISPLGFQ